MKIKSTIPFAVDDVLLNRLVEPGEIVEVTPEQGAHRLAQVGNWVEVDDDPAAPPAAPPAEPSADADLITAQEA
ncbi:MAG: hypothetical protein HY829_10465 [Actinobacteria bacterium]|nr:hypothetical protein [Actinomycetota bacterium]